MTNGRASGWAALGPLALLGLAFAQSIATGNAAPAAIPAARLCAEATRMAEARHATPPGLLDAIARAESGLTDPETKRFVAWPWTVNIAGQGHYLPSREAAVHIAGQGLASKTGNVDVGCMQISLPHHPNAFRSLRDAFDPATNADYAARFLLSLRDAAGGNWFIAVGLYHSRTPELARMYRERVSLAGSAIRPAGAGKLRVTLANGRVFTINTARQPARRGRHRSACEVAAILGSYAPSAVHARACGAARAEARLDARKETRLDAGAETRLDARAEARLDARAEARLDD